MYAEACMRHVHNVVETVVKPLAAPNAGLCRESLRSNPSEILQSSKGDPYQPCREKRPAIDRGHTGQILLPSASNHVQRNCCRNRF